MSFNNKKISLPVTFEIKDKVIHKDTRFINVTIDVLNTGINYNESYFDKEIVNQNIETIKNIPILGFIDKNVYSENDFKGHEYILTKTENGVERKYIGSAYGIVPESCNPRWINKFDDKAIETLQIDALLWTKFSNSTEIMTRDIEKPHSMELNPESVDGYEDDNGIFHFTKFSFDGCCILGSDKEPAMNDSKIQVNFSISDFVKEIQNEILDKFTAFTKLVNIKQEGGKIMPNTDFTQTVMQQFEDISNIVRQYSVVKDRWGDAVPRYYAMDIQDNEVIVTDRANNYQYYGFPFTMNGDKAEIDFTKGNRKKLCYTNYEEGATALQGSFDFGNHIAEIEETSFQKVTDAKAKVTTAEINYSNIKKDYDVIKPKYDEYVKAEQKQQENALNAEKDAMFVRFENDLNENTDFIALKEKRNEMSVEEIEEKCSVLFTRIIKNQKKDNSDKTNFSKYYNSATVEIMDNDSNDEDVSYVPTKYGNIPIHR